MIPSNLASAVHEDGGNAGTITELKGSFQGYYHVGIEGEYLVYCINYKAACAAYAMIDAEEEGKLLSMQRRT